MVSFYIILINEFNTGVFAPMEKDMFKKFLIKPYTKIHAIFLGIFMAFFFRNINEQKFNNDFNKYIILLK